MANRPIKPNGLSLTRVLIFAARGAAVKHFYVCARDVAKSPLTPSHENYSFQRKRERGGEREIEQANTLALCKSRL